MSGSLQEHDRPDFRRICRRVSRSSYGLSAAPEPGESLPLVNPPMNDSIRRFPRIYLPVSYKHRSLPYFCLLAYFLLLAAPGCSKPATVAAPTSSPAVSTAGPVQESPSMIDVCSLLTPKEIEAIQGAPFKM